MKKILNSIVLVSLLLISSAILPNNHETVIQAQESYEKWGRIAMLETKSKYPNADIIDYEHIGKETKGENSIEKFKLWLREDKREFGVYVNIEFETETEKVKSIKFEETDR